MSFDRTAFISWLEHQDPHETFDYESMWDCCLARFLRHTVPGSKPRVLQTTYRINPTDPTDHGIPADVASALRFENDGELEDTATGTFGEVLARLKGTSHAAAA